MKVPIYISCLLLFCACHYQKQSKLKGEDSHQLVDSSAFSQLSKVRPYDKGKFKISAEKSKEDYNTGVTNGEIYKFMIDYLEQYGSKSIYIQIEPLMKNSDSTYLKQIAKWNNNSHNDTIYVDKNVIPLKDYYFMLSQLKRYNYFIWNPHIICNGSEASEEDYPRYQFSIPLFSKDKKSVLFTEIYLCKGLCGGGTTSIYYKKGGRRRRCRNLYALGLCLFLHS